MEPSRFEVFRQASQIATKPPTWEDVLTAILVIFLFVIFFIVIPYYIYRKYKEIVRRRAFFEVAKTCSQFFQDLVNKRGLLFMETFKGV